MERPVVKQNVMVGICVVLLGFAHVCVELVESPGIHQSPGWPGSCAGAAALAAGKVGAAVLGVPRRPRFPSLLDHGRSGEEDTSRREGRTYVVAHVRFG